jgi:hypothetical protein
MDEAVPLVIPVLGIPTRFESNSPAILRVAEEAFGAWKVLCDGQPLDGPPALVRIDMRPGDEGGVARVPTRWTPADGGAWRLETPGSSGLSDPAARVARAAVTEALVADREHFRYGVLEALTLSLLTQYDRQPLHAAALVRGRTVLLLAGPSGMGKSTLVYAAVRAGLQVLAEDMVFLQLRPGLRVWGMPGYLHPDPGAREHFPELADSAPAVRANGKAKLALSLHALGAAAPWPVVERAGVCILERGTEGPSLVSLSAAEVERALTAEMEEGFDRFVDTIGAGIRLLAEHGGWRLTLAGPPDAALPLLAQMFDALDSRGTATSSGVVQV